MRKSIILLETKDLKIIDGFMKNLEKETDEKYKGIVVLTNFEELKKYLFYDSFDEDFSKDFVYDVFIADPDMNKKDKSTMKLREARVVFSMKADISLPSGLRVF